MIKHIQPKEDHTNGVSLYSKLVDKLLVMLPVGLRQADIAHYELGYSGHHELWQAWRSTKRSAAKVVITLHDPPVVVGKPFAEYITSNFFAARVLRKLLDKTIGGQIIKRVVKSADAIIVLNPLATQAIAEDFGIPDSKLFVSTLPNLNDTKPNVISRKGSILFFGNLAQHKGLDTLIAAYLKSNANSAKTPLVIAGGWGDNAAYRQRITDRAAHQPNVVFAGRVDDQELVNLISSATMVVLPYLNSGIIHASGPLVTSMALGKPIIVSDTPAFTGYVQDRVNGLIFKPGDEMALAGTIDELCSNHALSAEIAKNAKRFIDEKSSDSAMLADLEKVYLSV